MDCLSIFHEIDRRPMRGYLTGRTRPARVAVRAAKEGAAGGGLKEQASSRPTGQKQLAGLRVWFAAQLLPQKLRL